MVECGPCSSPTDVPGPAPSRKPGQAEPFKPGRAEPLDGSATALARLEEAGASGSGRGFGTIYINAK